MLADYGAEVLKVEDTGRGDYVRWTAPRYEGAHQSASSALFLALNRGKRSIRINLREEAGREVLLGLVHEYEVLLESFRPGVLDRLRVGYERLRDENPRLIYCAITGYGQDGPYRDPRRPRHELPRPRRNCSLSPASPTGAGSGRRPDRRPGRGRPDGSVRNPRRPAGARPVGSGPARRRLDGRRGESWLALAAARYLCGGEVPARGRLELAAASSATGRTPAPTAT